MKDKSTKKTNKTINAKQTNLLAKEKWDYRELLPKVRQFENLRVSITYFIYKCTGDQC